MNKEKPISVKPMFYSVILESLKTIVNEFGYNLVVHGSMNRDLDLILIPWVDDCNHPDEVVQAMASMLGGKIIPQGSSDSLSMPIPQGAGRISYLINLNRDGRFSNYCDKEYYLDISLTPNGKK